MTLSGQGERPHSRVSAASPGGRYGTNRVERTTFTVLKVVGWVAFVAVCLVPALVTLWG